MISSRLRRNGRKGRSGGGHGPLALVPMIDMLTILVVYLLVHAADMEVLPNVKNIPIPQSASEKKPHATTVVMVTRDTLYVGGVNVMSVADLRTAPEPVVETLRAALEREMATLVVEPDGRREVTVMADKSLPYAVMRKIVASSSAAQYEKVSLAVLEREASFAGGPGA
jgi:biopolymer transport protein ExbD